MATGSHGWTDQQVERLLGNLLRIGVLLSAVVVLAGGVVYLVRHGNDLVEYRTFEEGPPQERKPREILRNAEHLHGRGIIQLGLLLLIATPVARVLFSVFAFFRERDYLYVGLTLLVLVVLLYSLLFSET